MRAASTPDVADPTRRTFAVPADYDPDNASHAAALRAHVDGEHGDNWEIIDIVDGMCRIQAAGRPESEPAPVFDLPAFPDDDDAPDISGIDF